jgi:hypothetical protein
MAGLDMDGVGGLCACVCWTEVLLVPGRAAALQLNRSHTLSQSSFQTPSSRSREFLVALYNQQQVHCMSCHPHLQPE